MFDIFELIGHIAETTTTVLIEGETGTGKEQVAQAIHQSSATHRSGPFVAVHCAALPETLLESELFGHEKGAFTGAAVQRKGRFELAHGGTLFLDEVGDIPMAMQVKLLRVLQERRFERVGGNQSIEIDVRVIAATNRSLEAMVKEGKFREDLYYRLNVVKIDLPPSAGGPRTSPCWPPTSPRNTPGPARMPLRSPRRRWSACSPTHWPGNIRQLENALERACVTARGGVIRPENLPSDLLPKPGRGKASLHVDLARPLAEQLGELTAASRNATCAGPCARPGDTSDVAPRSAASPGAASRPRSRSTRSIRPRTSRSDVIPIRGSHRSARRGPRGSCRCWPACRGSRRNGACPGRRDFARPL